LNTRATAPNKPPDTYVEPVRHGFNAGQRQRWGITRMKRIRALASAIAGLILAAGCDRTVVVDRPPAQVVQAAESLAPWSNPPRYKTTEVALGQEWTVVITENVPGQKFEHYEITFRVVKVEPDRAQVTVLADHINTLPLSASRTEAPRVARRYMERLATQANKMQPQHGAAPLPSAPAGPSEGAR